MIPSQMTTTSKMTILSAQPTIRPMSAELCISAEKYNFYGDLSNPWFNTFYCSCSCWLD